MGMTNQKAVRILEEQRNRFMDEYVDFGGVNEAYNKAIDLLKRQEPKPPIHIHEEYPEHDWEIDKDGNIDEWVLDCGYHNGPGCKRCGYSFCMHCKPNGWNEEPCVIDYYQCPSCKKQVWKPTRFCSDCGQELNWNEGD